MFNCDIFNFDVELILMLSNTKAIEGKRNNHSGKKKSEKQTHPSPEASLALFLRIAILAMVFANGFASLLI